jgi:signal peptidase I
MKGSAMKNIKLILLSLSIILLMIINPFKLIVVVGDSMYPTLKSGNILIAKKSDHFNRGDIVVVKAEDGAIIIKRVYAVPGDRIWYYFKDKKYFLEDNYFDIRNFILSNPNEPLYEYKLREDFYFLIGDNKNNSEDSRDFGAISKYSILYKVIK